jgi:hypothetical protein
MEVWLKRIISWVGKIGEIMCWSILGVGAIVMMLVVVGMILRVSGIEGEELEAKIDSIDDPAVGQLVIPIVIGIFVARSLFKWLVYTFVPIVKRKH